MRTALILLAPYLLALGACVAPAQAPPEPPKVEHHIPPDLQVMCVGGVVVVASELAQEAAMSQMPCGPSA